MLNHFVFLAPATIPAFLLAATSPSPNHLLALTSWITLIICLPAMGRKLIPARIHGTVLSILFALAISSAPADHGFVKSILGLGCAGEPGWAGDAALIEEDGFKGSEGTTREGERYGEEKERR